MKTRKEIETEIRRSLSLYEKNVNEGVVIRNLYSERILALFYVLEYVVPLDIQDAVNRLPFFPFKFGLINVT